MSEHLHEFVNAMRGVGGPSEECMCGRAHYAIDSDVMEPEEREHAIACHRENINTVVLVHDVDCVMIYTFGHWHVVEDCPCKGLERLEEVLWAERDVIREFFRNRVTRMVLESTKEADGNAVMSHSLLRPATPQDAGKTPMTVNKPRSFA